MRLEDLDCSQALVVDFITGQHDKVLVLGGAGTGKTTTALCSARKFLEMQTTGNPSRVLFLTFSRTAVKQITQRSPGVLAGFQDRIEVMTFHGLSHWLIRAFGRYAGFGNKQLDLQSDARSKLLGADVERLTYNDLIPGAIKILSQGVRVRDIISSRWGLIICDEAQDTSTEQWHLISLLQTNKVLMLGDFNQMIYSSFVPGVSRRQFEHIREDADVEIHLKQQSYRDPSGAIPSAAEAILRRDFMADSVKEAIRTNRFKIYFETIADARLSIIRREIEDARLNEMKDVGIFSGSNKAVAEIAESLVEIGIDHALVGIPEAHAEAIKAMTTQCSYAQGLASEKDLRESLAIFTTACVRGRNVPDMAMALIGKGKLPNVIERSISELTCALETAGQGNIGDVGEIAMRSWRGLGFTFGHKPWERAGRHFARMIHRIRGNSCDEESIQLLMRMTDRNFAESLIDLDITETERVKLMTFHQTKGREADLAIHVFNPDDFFGRGKEPFEAASRLLYVAISRARKRVVVILPMNPHPLVGPYRTLMDIQRDIEMETQHL